MESTEEYAKQYPDIYFAHGTGYLSNGKNFTNYFGRIYQARYLSGLVAGLKTKTNKLGYVSAMGVDNSECTGGIDAFAMGVEKVNPDAKVYVAVTDSWFSPEDEQAASDALIALGYARPHLVYRRDDTYYKSDDRTEVARKRPANAYKTKRRLDAQPFPTGSTLHHGTATVATPAMDRYVQLRRI